MPQGRGAKSKKRTSKAAPEEAPAAEQPIDGALITNVPNEEGGTHRQIQALGDVTINELPTLLRLAAKDVERGLGLE